MASLVRRRDRPAFEWPAWPEWFGRWLDVPDELVATSGMKVEERREDGVVVVRAELPGIDPERDVEITVQDGTLRIHAERREETKTEDKDRYRSEFRYGSFVRTLALPAGASEEDVKATYKDGILEVRVPVDEEKVGAKRIAIERA
jgi:HSP20 family protein